MGEESGAWACAMTAARAVRRAGGWVGAGDVVIGAFDFDGATAGAATYVLSPTAELREEMRLGRVVSLRLFAASETISYQFNSRNFVNGPTWPVMEVAAEALCAGDFNGGDGASVQDIFDFLAAYFEGCEQVGPEGPVARRRIRVRARGRIARKADE